jgi:hypothetical protein
MYLVCFVFDGFDRQTRLFSAHPALIVGGNCGGSLRCLRRSCAMNDVRVRSMFRLCAILAQLPHYICRKWPILSFLDLDVSLYQRACPKTPKIVTNYWSHLGAGGRPPVAAVAVAHDFFRSSS